MQLVILMGLQAAGKSTFYRTRFAETHVHVSKDGFRHNKNRERRQMALVEGALQAGERVVVDNTNPSRQERAGLIALGRQFKAEIVGYYLAVSLQTCRDRNALRTGHARVPDVALYATLKRLERPSWDEGFDQLFYVAEDGTMEPWRDDDAPG